MKSEILVTLSGQKGSEKYWYIRLRLTEAFAITATLPASSAAEAEMKFRTVLKTYWQQWGEFV